MLRWTIIAMLLSCLRHTALPLRYVFNVLARHFLGRFACLEGNKHAKPRIYPKELINLNQRVASNLSL